jgi:hypothetical protein
MKLEPSKTVKKQIQALSERRSILKPDVPKPTPQEAESRVWLAIPAW